MGTYLNLDGEPITIAEWIRLCQGQGIGAVLAESTVPVIGGAGSSDVTIRTKWFGLVVPELGIRPFGTASRAADGTWAELEEYDTRRDAETGHVRWAARLAGVDLDERSPS